MACYRPIDAFRTPDGVVFSALGRYDIIGEIQIPCGRCLGCRERRARDWTLRCVHESQMWDTNCFVTLTYKRDGLPAGGSLDHRDFQLFMKRLYIRMRREAHGIGRLWEQNVPRFFMCGEYGPTTGRAHYHAILFNVDFPDKVLCGKSKSGQLMYESEILNGLWTHGRCTVQDCNTATIGYVTRYIIDKFVGDEEAKREHYTVVDADGVITERKPEYCIGSLKPGIGARWFAKFHRDIYPHDRAVLDGQEYAVPKYYDKLLERMDRYDPDSIEFRRQEKAKDGWQDNTAERLAVREVVHKARLSTLRRDGNE